MTGATDAMALGARVSAIKSMHGVNEQQPLVLRAVPLPPSIFDVRVEEPEFVGWS